MKNIESENTPPVTLIATIGSSPAVLTEALYALYEEGSRPVQKVELITTSHGKERLNSELFHYGKQKGGFYQLCEELNIPPNTIDIAMGDELKAVGEAEGTPLDDIRNHQEDKILAGYIQKTVQKHCRGDTGKVVAVLSGGRKTMSSHLASAMQLFGRSQDRMIHVLVNEPYEEMKDFYFPTAESRMLTPRNPKVKPVDAKDAKLDVIDIPFIKLRSYLHDRLDFSGDFEDVLRQVDRHLRSDADLPVQSLRVDVVDSTISINGLHNTIKPERRPFSIFALLAVLNRAEGKPIDVTWRQILNDERYRHLLHTIYRIACYGRRDHLDQEIMEDELEQAMEDDKWYDLRYWLEPRGEEWVLHKRDFPKQRRSLVKSIEEGLQTSPELHELSVDDLFTYQPHRRDALGVVHRLPVHPDRIEITGLTEEEVHEILE